MAYQLTPEQRAFIRERTIRERREQGLPERTEDPATLAKIARIVARVKRDAERRQSMEPPT